MSRQRLLLVPTRPGHAPFLLGRSSVLGPIAWLAEWGGGPPYSPLMSPPSQASVPGGADQALAGALGHGLPLLAENLSAPVSHTQQIRLRVECEEEQTSHGHMHTHAPTRTRAQGRKVTSPLEGRLRELIQ